MDAVLGMLCRTPYAAPREIAVLPWTEASTSATSNEEAFYAVKAYVSKLLLTALLLTYERRFHEAGRMCERILRIDPHYPIALELRDVVRRFETGESNPDDARKIDEWHAQTRPPDFPSQTFRFPSAEEWAELRHSAETIASNLPVRLEGFEAVLEATRVDVSAENWPLSAIVEEFRAKTGLDLRLLGEPEEYISFKVRDMRIKPALKLLLGPRNLAYRVDGVTLWIGQAEVLPAPERQ
jgi:hypothetical protein